VKKIMPWPTLEFICDSPDFKGFHAVDEEGWICGLWVGNGGIVTFRQPFGLTAWVPMLLGRSGNGL
jgi:hypothetical protein